MVLAVLLAWGGRREAAQGWLWETSRGLDPVPSDEQVPSRVEGHPPEPPQASRGVRAGQMSDPQNRHCQGWAASAAHCHQTLRPGLLGLQSTALL